MLNEKTAAPELFYLRNNLNFVAKPRRCVEGSLHVDHRNPDDAVSLKHPPLDQAGFLEEGCRAVVEENEITREIHDLSRIAIAPFDSDRLAACQMRSLAHQSNRNIFEIEAITLNFSLTKQTGKVGRKKTPGPRRSGLFRLPSLNCRAVTRY